MTRQGLLVVGLGWVAVVALPMVIALINWASNAKRKRVNLSRPRRSSREMHFSSELAEVDGGVDLFRSGSGEMTATMNQVELELQSEECHADIHR